MKLEGILIEVVYIACFITAIYTYLHVGKLKKLKTSENQEVMNARIRKVERIRNVCIAVVFLPFIMAFIGLFALPFTGWPNK
jgi:hypothetical protein